MLTRNHTTYSFAAMPTNELEALALEIFSTTPGCDIDCAARGAFDQYTDLLGFAAAWDFDVACLAIEAGDVETIEACKVTQ